MRALLMVAFFALTAFGCTCGKDEPTPGSSQPSTPNASGDTQVEVGDRLHVARETWTPEDLEAYPVPAPVDTVARETAIPRLEMAAAGAEPKAEAGNKAVKLSLLSVSRSAALPGAVAPEGREFVVLHTRWENIHPRAKVRKSDLQADYTMGVGGFAQGRSAPGSAEEELIEADVAYRIPAMEDHAWLLANGAAWPLSPSTVRMHQGAPYRRPFTLVEHGSAQELRLAYEVPKGTRDLSLRFFDDDYGHIALPVEGDETKAASSTAPEAAMARAKNQRVELVLSKVEDRSDYAGVAAPEGWRFVVATVSGKGLPTEKKPAAIVQVDPRRYIWAVTAQGHVRYASGGSVGHKGLLRFPPDLYRQNEVAFVVPKGEPVASVVVRDGAELLELATGGAPSLPKAQASARDGEVMDVEVVGLWRGDAETVVDLVVKSRVAGSGIELQPEQFKLDIGRKQLSPNRQRTATLVHRPPSPFVIPPKGAARFKLSYDSAEPPQALSIEGLTQKEPIALALTGVSESPDEPPRGDPSPRADDVIPPDPYVPEGSSWSDAEKRAVVFGGPRSYSSGERRPSDAPAPPPPFPDDREPNDQFERASPLGEGRSAKGSFASTSDFDAYRFTVSGAPALWRLEAEGTGLARLEYRGTTSSSHQQVYAENGRAVLHDLLLAPGDHFLGVKGESSATYEVRAVPQGAQPEGYEGEPNDSPQRAHELRPGQTRVGRLPNKNDTDHYRFSLVRREHVAISLTSPEDGLHLFELALGGFRQRGEPLAKGGRARWEGWLAPGDYSLLVRTREPSTGTYALRVERLDPFITTGDLEPNDDAAHASALPTSLIVTGAPREPHDVDYFALPVAAREQVVTASLRGKISDVSIRGENNRTIGERSSRDGPRYQAKIPPNTRSFLAVRGEGEYAVELSVEGGPTPQRESGLAWPLTFPEKVEPFAAWWHQSQRRELPLKVQNPTATAGEVALRAWSSHPDWKVEVPAKVTVPAGQSVEVPVTVSVAADAWSDRPVRVAVEAVGAGGARRVTNLELSAECGAAPSNARAAFELPEQLIGGLDVASAALGGTATGSKYPDRLEHLLSGLVTIDRNFYERELPIELTFDLAGDEALPIAGFLLHPPGGPDYDPMRDFEVLLSEDGQTFSSVVTATLQPEAREQAFVLPRPVSARFARLRLKSATLEKSGYVGLATFKVIAVPGKVPSSGASGFNVAAPALGGHVVWASEGFHAPRGMLTEEKDASSLRTNPASRARFVVGFHHQRAALLRGLEWTSSLSGVQVAVSTETPFGPWTPVGTIAADPNGADGTSPLAFEKPTWARYVQFTLADAQKVESVPAPETIRIFEVGTDAQYRSVIAEWGGTSRSASFEQLTPPPATTVAQAAPHTSQAAALAIAAAAKHEDSVERGVDEDWYRFEIPEGHNTLQLNVSSEDLHRLQWRLSSDDGKEVAMTRSEASPNELQLVAVVEPKKTYFLQVEEPVRSIVFAWDSSGSVSQFHPQIYRAISRFAASVQPGRERVQLVPFVRPILPTWASDTYALQHAIHQYDERDGSSDAEGALTIATQQLAEASGSRAVMIVTDDDSGANSTGESRLWSLMSSVRPRVFSVQIPVGGQPALFQDRMQSWASVNAGHYSTFRSSEDLELAFDRATCLMRRPAPYALSFETLHTVPPAPGTLAVKRDGPAPDGTAFEIIFDASGSMHKKLGKKSRVDIARAVLSNLVSRTIPAGTPVALRAFGHKEPRSCRTDLVVPLSPLDRTRMAETIRRIDPKDRSGTPLAASLLAVSEDLRRAGDKKVVVLVTDGEESCGGDPGAAIQELKAKGFDVRLNIVGFAIDGAGAHQEFQRWAELGGGRYYNAQSDEELTRALEQALNPPFQVLGRNSEVLHTGTVNGPQIEVPPGEYAVKVLSTPPHLFDRVKVESAQPLKLTLPGR